MYVCLYVCMCVCMYVCIYIYIFIHVCLHMMQLIAHLEGVQAVGNLHEGSGDLKKPLLYYIHIYVL